MGKKNTSNKFNSYTSFEDSIISIAKNELKQNHSTLPKSKDDSLKLKPGSAVVGGAIGAMIGGPHGAAVGGIAGGILGGIGAAVGGAIIDFGLTESYYSEDLEKRYRDYIKANYEMEFSKHKNDVPYIQSLISRAVKAVKELMSTSSCTAPAIMGSPVGIVSALYSDSDNNENEK